MKRPTKRTMISVLLGCVAAFALAMVWLSRVNFGLAMNIVVPAVFLAAFVLVIWLWDIITGLLQNLLWPSGVPGHDHRDVEIELRERRKMPTRFEFTDEQNVRYKKWLKTQRPSFNPSLIILPVAVILAIWGLLRYCNVTLPSTVEWLWPVICLVVMEFLVMRSMKAAILRMQSGFYPAISRCASCGYDLTGLCAEADGCTVCPECSAAWRLNCCRECCCRLPEGVEAVCEECSGQGKAEGKPDRKRDQAVL